MGGHCLVLAGKNMMSTTWQYPKKKPYYYSPYPGYSRLAQRALTLGLGYLCSAYTHQDWRPIIMKFCTQLKDTISYRIFIKIRAYNNINMTFIWYQKFCIFLGFQLIAFSFKFSQVESKQSQSECGSKLNVYSELHTHTHTYIYAI